MTTKPRRPRTTFKVTPLKDGTYGVEVAAPNAAPVTYTGFATEAAAEAWKLNKMREVSQEMMQTLAGTAREKLRERGMTDAQIDAELAKPERRHSSDMNSRAKSVVDRLIRDTD